MQLKNWIQDIFTSKNRVAIPIMTHPGIDLIGKKVRDAVTDGTIHAAAIKALTDKYPSAASTVIMDLTVEAEAFGSTITFHDDEVPVITGRLVYNYESIEALAVPGLDGARVTQYLKATQLAAKQINDRPLFAGCIGPYSLAGRLFDMTEIMTAVYIEPESIKLLLEKCTRFITAYALELKKAGADGLIIAEPAAGLLSEDLCQEFSSVYVKQIVEAVQDDAFAIILHNCGNKGHCTDAMLYTGAVGYHFGNQIDMIETLDKVPSDKLVLGNLDPVMAFKMSLPLRMYELTTELLEKTKKYPNFIISSGCDTPPNVPQANIEAFYKAVSDFNNKYNPVPK